MDSSTNGALANLIVSVLLASLQGDLWLESGPRSEPSQVSPRVS